MTVFVGFGLSPQQDRNTVYHYGQAGVNVVGLVPFRPKDVLGLAATYTRFSTDFVDANRVAGTPVTSQEAIVELTYQAVITPFLTLQPDLQLVFDANQSRRDAVVFGVRLVATCHSGHERVYDYHGRRRSIPKGRGSRSGAPSCAIATCSVFGQVPVLPDGI